MMHVEVSRQASVGFLGPLRQLLIIGGLGDLSRRHLLPALARLLANDELPPDFSITLAGLEPMPVEACRALIGRELSIYAEQLPTEARRALVERISYLRADVRDVDAFQAVAVTEPMLVYVATPAEVVPAAVRALFRAGIHCAPARIVFDKPFGLSRSSAQALNGQILELMDEQNVYRVDHFLYHHTVQELMRWRMQPDGLSLGEFACAPKVEIIWDETRTVRTGGLSYCGVVRDMIQSHLLQLAAILTMDSPESITHTELARHRLGALRQLSVDGDAGLELVRGRHLGRTETNASSTTRGPETFATMALRSQVPRWDNVRFLLRAAKGVDESRRRIELRFPRPSAGASFGFLRLEVLTGNLVIGLAGRQASTVSLDISSEKESASTRLLRAALLGDDTFTLGPKEPQEGWRIVEPVLRAWEESDPPMLTYRVGTSPDEIASGAESSSA